MASRPITENTLFYGDNLDILRQYLLDESVDLIYLDPPFNSSRNYNILFKDEGGTESEAQITAFEDTWHWNHVAEQTYHYLVTQSPDHIATMIEALRKIVGSNQIMAYLIMMAARLMELHRVLKPTGSLYLHCDPLPAITSKSSSIPFLARNNLRMKLFGREQAPIMTQQLVEMRMTSCYSILNQTLSPGTGNIRLMTKAMFKATTEE